VPPEEFFGRQDIIRLIARDLRAGGSVVVQGLPRSGRSSLLYVLFKNYKQIEEGALAWLVDLNALNDPGDLVEEFYNAMRVDAGSRVVGDLARALKGWERRLVMFLDGADRLIEPPLRDEALFAMLLSPMQTRRVSLCLAMTTAPEKLFLDRASLPLFAHCAVHRLRPFTAQETRQLIEQHLQWTGIAFTDAEMDVIVKQSGGLAGDVQRLAGLLYEKKKAHLGASGDALRGRASSRRKR